MSIEKKSISLTEFKGLDGEGPGTFEGYPSAFGDIDSYGDIIAAGAYTATIPKFLHIGFTAHSHEWGCDASIGFPIEAREDSYGLFCKSQFHSTADAQNIRTKVKERLEAGKFVGLSIGFSIKRAEYIMPEAYEAELPKYLNPQRLDELMDKAKSMNCIRILHEIELFEYSIVTMPAQKIAQVTSAKDFEPSPADGLTLKDHSDSVLAAVTGYTERMENLSGLRAKEGRVLSSTNFDGIATIREQLVGACERLNAILESARPEKQYLPSAVAQAMITYNIRTDNV